MQAGLSWLTILKKRDNFRKAFDDYDAEKIARYDQKKTDSLLADAGIIRNRLKIAASIRNAREFLNLQEEFGSFDKYIWQFTGGKPIQNQNESMSDIPTQTVESTAMSKALKARGFKFCGPTICYAFMQAVGMVNDHALDCDRHAEVAKLWPN